MIPERPVSITACSGTTLEGALALPADACGRRGLATLRFNFRGVGGSEGVRDEGRGEQDDVRAGLALIAPPLASAGWQRFSALPTDRPLLIVAGGEDTHCPREALAQALPRRHRHADRRRRPLLPFGAGRACRRPRRLGREAGDLDPGETHRGRGPGR